MIKTLKAGAEDVRDLVFPSVCYSCGRRTKRPAPLCRFCEGGLCEATRSLCYGCDPNSLLSAKIEADLPCGVPGHDNFGVASGLLMRGPAADLIHCFKYAGARRMARVLARHSLDAFRKVNPSVPDFIVAVPLHQARLRQRGYNQSQLLAEELTMLTGVITAPGLLVRGRATRAQVALPLERREANVSGAFVVRFPEVLMGKAVTVVDDVATTGATLRACAGPLLDAGASRVTAVVAAIS